ncbi:hypothetical protein [Streptomyces sp. PvR034]|uniref:hypothetical protein n=1 Tax=Streptomyces sp. PvR034 TaxID=3156401 RepID=UPI0033944CBA
MGPEAVRPLARSRSGGWQNHGQVATGLTTDRSRVRLADIGGDGHGSWGNLGQIVGGVTTVQGNVQFADFNGDTHVDYILTGSGDSASVYLFDGFGAGWLYQGPVV